MQLLRSRFECFDCGHALAGGMHLWAYAGRRWGRLAVAARLIFINVLSLFRVLLKVRAGDVVYVRYPSLFFMLLVGMLPAFIRPRCVVDAYISIWDAWINDRAYARSGIFSSALRCLEEFSLKAAWKVLVDTTANGSFMVDCFGLSPAKVVVVPLAIDEKAWAGGIGQSQVRHGQHSEAPRMSVVYLGTFVPLHGLQVVVGAIRKLAHLADVEYVFIGDGQQAHLLEELIEQLPEGHRVVWMRGFYAPGEIVSRIRSADVALGVFGGGGKAGRVLPFKLYIHLLLGKCVVTQRAHSMPDVEVPLPAVFADNSMELAAALEALYASDDLIGSVARRAENFYHLHLSNAHVLARWCEILQA
jgi:hypothetical protein